MFEYVKVVSQFSNVAKWKKESDDMESMLIAIEKGCNIISYVDFSKIFHVIRCIVFVIDIHIIPISIRWHTSYTTFI